MLSQALTLIEASKYFLIFLASFFEGSVAMMTGGLLYRLGHVAFWPMYLALFAGDVLADLVWYAVGRYGARGFFEKYGKYVGLTLPVLARAEEKFHKHHLRILVISKLTMGFGLAVAVLATAGMLRVPLWRYLVITTAGGVVWISLLIGVGYYFGNVVEHLPGYVQIAAILGMMVVFFIALRFLVAYLAREDT